MQNKGKLLKQELEAKGLLFKFVAKKTGIGYHSLIHYLNDTKPIPEPKLRLICLEFGIDSKIFGLDDNLGCQKKGVVSK